MMPPSHSVHLWARTEVLEQGVLPILAADKISIEMLSRLLQHCIDLGEMGYPKLSYHTWKHISVKKMGLSSECAMVVFYTCLIFSQQQPDELKKVEADLAGASSQKNRDEILSEVEVSTLELVLLLYLHRFNSAHPRAQASQASFQCLTTDPWPGNSNITNNKKQLLEERFVDFIRDSLPEILSLLAGHLWQDEHEKRKGDKRSAKDLLCFMKPTGVLVLDVIQALGFIIGAICSTDKIERDLLSVATDKQHSYQSGYLNKPKKRSFQKGLFEQWLLRNLDWAPHGEWLCVGKGKRLKWPIISMASVPSYKIVTSPSSGGSRLILVSDLVDCMTVTAGDDASILPHLKVQKCSKSTIFVLQPFKNVVIHKCFDSRIILGAVSGRLKISECKNSVVVCPARSVVISECRGITVHTLTPQRPLLVGSRTHGVTFAPLNFHYPKLLQHLNTVGLHTHFNLWNRPLHLGSEGAITGSFDVMSHEDFFLLPMPFSFSDKNSPVDGRPPLLPPGLPHEFVKSVESRRRNVTSFRNEIQEASLSQEQQIRLQKTIDSRFQAWLKETGKQRVLDQMEKLNSYLKLQRVTKTTAI